MRICDRWMQDGTTDQRGRSHPPQCTTSREGRQIVRMAVTNRSVTSRTIAQHIESVTHHSMSACTIRCRLQQSGLFARRPLLGLPLTQNHRRLRRQWCDERMMWEAEWNEVVFTDESRICRSDSSLETPWREDAEQLRYTPPDYTPAVPPDQLWQRMEACWSAVPPKHIQSLFESIPKRVAAVISNNGGYSGY
ncbi:transposable element Tcb1 transposase [Trichonephila clavipes]|nr:transposable element Tcb1 transposase [Trichonephila clavipes]